MFGQWKQTTPRVALGAALLLLLASAPGARAQTAGFGKTTSSSPALAPSAGYSLTTSPSPKPTLQSALPGSGSTSVQPTTKALHSLLEIQRQGGEFVEWGVEKTLYAPGPVLLRWFHPSSAASFEWQLAAGPFPSSTILESGSQPAPGSGTVVFSLDLTPLLPGVPLEEPISRFLRIIPAGAQPSSQVEIIYMRDPSSTEFSSLGLDPTMLNPLRVFVDLDEFHVELADEEDDEEPYLINLLISLDGSGIDVFDLANSSVGIAVSEGTHGNVPQEYGDLGSGDTVYLSPGTGRFETTLLPLNPELADVNLFGTVIDAADLTSATTLLVVSIALEEDASSTVAAEAFKGALAQALQQELDQVLQSLTLADLLPFVQSSGDPMELVPNPNQEICDELAALNLGDLDLEDLHMIADCRPGWALMLARVKDFALEIAINAELSDLNLETIVANLISGIDPDDFIGVGIATFDMEQLRTASAPIDIEFLLERNNQSINEPVPHFVRYRISGSAGRCQQTDPSEPCTPYYAPVLWNGKLVYL
jgi:hypothetical protein